jgi:hypothetical protein
MGLNITKKSTAVATAPGAFPPSAYDYGALDADIAEAAKKAASRIRTRTQDAIMQNGKDLLRIKAKLPHGEFGKWIKAEFGMSNSTAQNYMNAAELVDKNPTVAILPPATLYNLGAKGTPAEVVETVSAKIASGTPPKPAEVVDLITKAKEAKQATADAVVTPEQIDKLVKDGKAKAEKLKAKAEAPKVAAAHAFNMVFNGLGAKFGEFRALLIKSGDPEIFFKLVKSDKGQNA